jgi:hypothetical protein
MKICHKEDSVRILPISPKNIDKINFFSYNKVVISVRMFGLRCGAGQFPVVRLA